MAEIISFDTRLPYRPINMCEPTAAQQMCIHYALDACQGDCDRCPGAELLAEKKAEAAFDRLRRAQSRNAKIIERVQITALVLALGMIGFLAAANFGLSRAEHYYQMEARV